MSLSRRSLLGAAALGATACSIGLGTAAQAAPNASSITPDDPYGPDTDLHTRKFDFRAMWIATVANIDFPPSAD